MQGFWLTLVWGLAALLAVSVLVALVEFLRQDARPARPIESPLPRALKVDLDVDALPSQPPAPPPSRPEARVALGEVLQRLQQTGPDAPWIETTPMVLAAAGGSPSRDAAPSSAPASSPSHGSQPA